MTLKIDTYKKAILLFLIFLFTPMFSIAAPTTLMQGQIINYQEQEWKVYSFNKEKKTVTLCPYYDYARYFNSSNWGWFYDKKCKTVALNSLLKHKNNKIIPKPEKKNPEQEHNIMKLAQNPKYLNSLTADQYKKFYAKVRNISVMHPIEKNISAYMYMTNFTRLKALIFSHAVADYTMNHPQYNMQKTIGTTSWSINAYNQTQNNNIHSLFNKYKNNLGLLVFIKNGCPYCMKQVPVLNWFQSDYGINVLAVSKNGCPNTMNIKCINKPSAFDFYKVQYEPTIVLVIKQKNGSPKFYPVGVGLTDEVTLSKRVYNYVKNYYNPDEKYSDSNLYKLIKGGK